MGKGEYSSDEWEDNECDAMPNGYVDATRVLTKILKHVLAYLKKQGYMVHR